MAETKKVKARSLLPRCCACTLRSAGAAVLLLLAACSDEATNDGAPPAPPSSESKVPIHSLEWLKRTDQVTAEQWLASREAGRDVDGYDPAVSKMHQVLDVAAMRFRDHPRMIANRAVQLQTMLKEKQIDEDAPSIIATLCEVPGNTRYVESFSSLTQQYYNLRLKGLDKAQAVAALRAQNDHP